MPTETKAQFQRRAALAARKIFCGTLGQPDYRPRATMAWYVGLFKPTQLGLVLANPDDHNDVNTLMEWAIGRGVGRHDPYGMDASAIRSIPQVWTQPPPNGFSVAQAEVGKNMLARSNAFEDRTRPFNCGTVEREGFVRTSDPDPNYDGSLDPSYAHVEQFSMPTDSHNWQNRRPTRPIRASAAYTCWQMVFGADCVPDANGVVWADRWASWGYNLLASQSPTDYQKVAQICAAHGVLPGWYYNYSDWDRDMTEADKTAYMNQICSWSQQARDLGFVRFQLRDSLHQIPPMFPTVAYNAEIAAMPAA